ncbi:MAG: hypothetical protein ISS56_20425 [Anaerolineae bacterium]|nr:hypothetical protein [Anaerolineae bacterium]
MNDPTIGQQMLTVAKWGAIIAGGSVGIPLPYRAARGVYDDIYERARRRFFEFFPQLSGERSQDSGFQENDQE